jgi:archaellum biogenesis ATPase FlaH
MFNQSCVLNFDDNGDTGSDFWDAESHKQKKLKRSPSGYDFIDHCLNGGYFSGALICFAGAPKTGKSLWMQNLCAKSVDKGENNAYVTLELPEEMVIERIGSNLFSIPSLEYSKYSNDTVEFKEKINRYRKSRLTPPGSLVVKEFPTSTLSVIELEAYLLKKEEELSTPDKPFKFKNIFIDYINIMKNYRNPNSENTYMKIKQLAEDLRAMGAKNGWCIITATQTNRSQFESNDMTQAQIAESAGLGATVDALFGIIADALMLAQG